MLSVIQTAALFSRADVPVLILGESGTGKEKIAQLIHHLSERASKSFEALNCAAIPKDLVESTLFGHQRDRSLVRRATSQANSNWLTGVRYS